MRTTNLLPVTVERGVVAVRPPEDWKRVSVGAQMSKPVTECDLERREVAIPKPMAPRPRKAICSGILFEVCGHS